MLQNQIHFPSLIHALHSVNRAPYINSDEITTTTIGLAALGHGNRTILAEETFRSHGMSQLGVQMKAGPILVRLSHLIDRIIASQLEHANTYRGKA